MKSGKMLRLMAMMFVQNMLFPIWFNTVVPYVEGLEGGSFWAPFCGSLIGIGMLASPIFCMVADRFLDSVKVLALCNLLSGLALFGAALSDNTAILFSCLAAATIFQMPTWSVAAAIAMAHAPTRCFPYIRACGSIGWACSAVISIVAIRCFGFENFEKSSGILWAGAVASVFGAFLSVLMPSTPPKAKGTPMSVVDALGLRAFALLKDRQFCILSVVLLLSMLSFQWYFGYNTKYLSEAGYTYLNLIQNLGQIPELGFMVLLPWMFSKLSFKRIMLIGLGALAFRYACFGLAAYTGVHALDFGGILIHGLIFGILIVGVQMHAAEIAPPELRNQAQGFVMSLASGVGNFLSVWFFVKVLERYEVAGGGHDWSVPYLIAFGIAMLAMVLFAVLYRAPKPAENK